MYAHSLQFQHEAEEARIKRDDKFRNLAQNLHHLMSTKHVRGVYNPQLDLMEVSLYLPELH